MVQVWPQFESCWLFKPTGGSPDMIHLIIYASTVLLSIFKATTGCPPKKCKFGVNALFSLLKCTRWVLKSSGNFLSNKHKNIIILWKNGLEKWGKRCLPPSKCEKPPKYFYFDKNVSQNEVNNSLPPCI